MQKAYVAVEDLINYLREQSNKLIEIGQDVRTDREIFENRCRRYEVIDLVKIIPKELEPKFVYAETEK